MDRPNIIFILADDHGAWALGCAGNKEIRTPNIDRLAARGLYFSNFFCASPVCSPARASILTGTIPSAHGVHDWIKLGNINGFERQGKIEDREICYLEGIPAYTDLLNEAGYSCALSGKWHLGASMTPQKGFTDWYTHCYGGGPYHNAEMIRDRCVVKTEDYVTDVITDHAIEFLEKQKAGQAFYLSVHYTAPHAPWDEQHHAGGVYDSYAECPFFSTPDLPFHPDHLAKTGPVKDRKKMLRGYYTAVTRMDENIGRIIDVCENSGLRDDTIIIFTGDNGMNMGHHGIYGKGNGTFPPNMYDTSVKVPMVVSWPGFLPKGKKIESMYSHYDIFPSLLDLCGIENPYAQDLPGKSFKAQMLGEADRGHDQLVVFDEYGPSRMIRTMEWKYVHRYPYGPDELYNLKQDPDEEKNLIDDPAYSVQKEKLENQLRIWFDRYTDPDRDGTKESVTGKGQVNLCGSRSGGKQAFHTDYTYLKKG